MYEKQFKDPIYGYIEVETQLVDSVIDTPTFQRLKDIRQTSYTPLYPAAYHNRYVHSLGVYHLGRIAFGAIKPQLEEFSQETHLHNRLEEISRIFTLACLLHDVGHAPFSHTGEAFFLDKSETLYNELKLSVNDASFSSDFDALGAKKPVPHECMSCIVGIKAFPSYLPTPELKSLFARCIIGMPMRLTTTAPEATPGMNSDQKREITRQRDAHNEIKKEYALLNCVISLLNSSIIDVDRLDYIIRDSETIGFKNAQVDYMRLLNGMRIVSQDRTYCIGYHKSALSVIESAVYAHDAEKKWVQGHPAILYEMEALKSAMTDLTARFATDDDPNPLFCYDALTEKGKVLKITEPLLSSSANDLFQSGKLLTESADGLFQSGGLFSDKLSIDSFSLTINHEFPVSLLADEDFLYLMKQFCKSGLGYEYFARNRRRIAVWKSEAEFRALFQERIGDESTSIKALEKDFEDLMNFCQDQIGVPILEKSIFDILDKEEKNAQTARDAKEIDKEQYEDILKGVETKRCWASVLKDVAQSLNIEFEFLIVFQKKFISSFKATIGDIPILFPNIDDGVVPLKDVINVIESGETKKSNFFHLFYKPIGVIDNERKKEIVNSIAKALIKEVK